mgnify:CR=1 FL=1
MESVDPAVLNKEEPATVAEEKNAEEKPVEENKAEEKPTEEEMKEESKVSTSSTPVKMST